MRTMLKKLFFLLLLLPVLSGCEHVIDEQEFSGEGGTGTAQIFVTLGGTAARTISPDAPDKSDFSDFVLRGTLNGNTSTLFTAATVSELSAAAIAIAPGDWTFTLSATYGGVNFSGTVSKTISSGDSQVLAFSLSAGSSYGSFSITIEIGSGAASRVMGQIFRPGDEVYQEAEELTASTGGSYTFAKSGIEAGIYSVLFTFYDGAGTQLNTFSSYMRIEPGLLTTCSTTINLNELYTITYDNGGGTLASGTQITSYSRKTPTITLPTMSKDGCVFAGWYDESGNLITKIEQGSIGNRSFSARFISSAVYVSQTGNDSNDGLSESTAVATLSQALTLLNSFSDKFGTSWAGTIRVSGTVTCNTFIEDSLNMASLTIEGLSGNSYDALDGNSGGTVLIISTSVPVTLRNLKVTNGKANYGGGLSIGNNATVTLGSGALITGCTAIYNGGGIYTNGMLTIESGAAVNQNHAGNTAGGISNYGTLTMNGGEVSDNICNAADSGWCGGVANQATFVMNGGSITNNRGGNTGGGVLNSGSVDGTETSIYFTMNGGTISGNTAGEGAGVRNSYRATFIMNGGKISGNTASTQGGAISTDNSSIVQLKGGTISGNSAPNGGGIFNVSGCAVTLSGTAAISGNSATYSGGGIYNQGTLTMTGGKISGNTAQTGGGVRNDSVFRMSGSAYIPAESAGSNDVYLESGKYIELTDTLSATTAAMITPQNYISGTKVLSGTALGTEYEKIAVTQIPDDSNIWGIMSDGTLQEIAYTNLYVSGTGGTLAEGNDSTGTGTKTAPYKTLRTAITKINGFNDETTDYTIYIDGEVSGTTSISTLTAAKLTITGVTSATKDSLNGGNGGSTLSISTGTDITLKNLKITGGAAANGAGLYLDGAMVSLESVTVSGNRASGNGGGIWSGNASSLTLTQNTTISGNTASQHGGGIYNSSDATLNMNSGVISGNTANQFGGGIYNANSFTMDDGIIASNTATQAGGGVYNTGTFTMGGGNITSNTTTYNGKGVYQDGTFYMGGSAVVDAGNDVYLNNKTITLYGMPENSSVATITPASYQDKLEVISFSSVMNGFVAVSKFSVTPQGGKQWKVSIGLNDNWMPAGLLDDD